MIIILPFKKINVRICNQQILSCNKESEHINDLIIIYILHIFFTNIIIIIYHIIYKIIKRAPKIEDFGRKRGRGSAEVVFLFYFYYDCLLYHVIYKCYL